MIFFLFQPPKKPAHPGEENRVRGFDRGLQAEKIIGATDATGELIFLIDMPFDKKNEFSCGVGSSNNFFLPGGPDRNLGPDFSPQAEQFFFQACVHHFTLFFNLIIDIFFFFSLQKNLLTRGRKIGSGVLIGVSRRKKLLEPLTPQEN